jgi:hypothetical protein
MPLARKEIGAILEFLVVGSQIGNLILDLSFGHNLCFKCPNGSCKPILEIYVPRAFQWYKEIFHPMGFDPCNCSLKIWESIGTLIPKVGFIWECGGSFPHTLPHFREHEMWLLASFLDHTFASPCLGCEPKARVAIIPRPFGSN